MQSVTDPAMVPGAGETPSPHFTSPTNFDDDGHCRIVDRMVALIMRRRKDGQPTGWNDLKEFTPSQIGAHWPEACRRADRVVIRDIHADEDEPDYSPRRLTAAVDIVAAMIPDDIQIGAALRAGGFPAEEQRAIWAGLMARLKPRARAFYELTAEPEAEAA